MLVKLGVGRPCGDARHVGDDVRRPRVCLVSQHHLYCVSMTAAESWTHCMRTVVLPLAGLAQMIAAMRPDIDNIDEYVRNTTARAFR